MVTIQEKYKEHIESFRQSVNEAVQKKFKLHKEVEPTVFALILQNDKVDIVVMDGLGPLFANNDVKELAPEIIKSINREIKPIAMAFICEGWALVVDQADASTVLDENGYYKEGSPTPANHPDKKEILLVSFETFKEQASSTWFIHRDAEAPYLKEQAVEGWKPKVDKNVGRFSNLLEDNYTEFARIITQENETRKN